MESPGLLCMAGLVEVGVMRLWTMQTLPVLEELESTGLYRPDPDFVEKNRICAEDFPPEEDPFYQSYLWIADQMAERVPPRPSPDSMPVWGWQQWNGTKQPKPDLRSTAHFMPGVKAVRLELELDHSRVLLSDFDLWFCPFSGLYLGRNLKEDQAFERAKKEAGVEANDVQARNLGLPVPLLNRLHKSWEKVFDMKFYRPGYNCGRKEKVVQATFWEIREEDVVKKTLFTAR
jgi:hypothetical protein